MASLVLSAAPLSGGIRDQIASEIAGELRYVNMSQLRHSDLSVWRDELLRRYEVVYMVAESSQQSATMSILMSVASIVPARSRVRWEGPGTVLPLRRTEAVAAAGSIALASWLSLVSLGWAWAELRTLRRAPRLMVAPMLGRRLLYLKTSLSPGVVAGGSVGHVAGVVGGFVNRNYDVVLASLDDPPNIPASVKMFRLEPLDVYSVPPDLNNYRFTLQNTRQLLAARGTLAPHAIYQRMATGNYAGVQLSRAIGVPFVLEYNGSEAWVARNWGKPLAFERAALACEDVCLRHAHVVVTVSAVLRDELLRRGIAADDIVMQPNGVDETVFDARRFGERDIDNWRRSHGVPKGPLVVCFVGTFGKWHGAEILAEAARRVLDADRKGFHFVFIGDGLTMPLVRKTLATYGDSVTFTGLVAQSATPLALAAADILVSPHRPNDDGSRFIGSPTKLFEYMAMGKPIIASRLDQIEDVLKPSPHVRELVEPSHARLAAYGNAIFVEPGSVDDLVKAVRVLADAPELRRTIADNARTLALSKHTWRQHVAAIAERLEAQ